MESPDRVLVGVPIIAFLVASIRKTIERNTCIRGACTSYFICIYTLFPAAGVGQGIGSMLISFCLVSDTLMCSQLGFL